MIVYACPTCKGKGGNVVRIYDEQIRKEAEIDETCYRCRGKKVVERFMLSDEEFKHAIPVEKK